MLDTPVRVVVPFALLTKPVKENCSSFAPLPGSIVPYPIAPKSVAIVSESPSMVNIERSVIVVAPMSTPAPAIAYGCNWFG